MQDLNDLYYFARVVEHGGFAPAGRALGVPKSTLSRRVALLEERLGSRLLQRSTRHFGTTEVGAVYYAHCVAMIAEAEAAQEAIDNTSAEPRGTIRVTCPISLMLSSVAPIVSRYLAAHPQVRVQLSVTNRRVDVIEEGVDVALRVRFPPLENEGLVMKRLAESKQILVGSPALLDQLGRPGSPAELSRLPGLDLIRSSPRHAWELQDAAGQVVSIMFEPRYATDDMYALRQAAEDGVGIAQVADYVVMDQIAAGALEVILPDWTLPSGIVHAVFPSRRGLSPAVRSFIDFLATDFRA
ncbi:MAG TPA: LysR substrate-binding domain-containing protein [Arsenicitalea sp.]|jgi:DNA-binding transcriptional LysR family regulator|nr:LysR substrate-binding domain-containing protein [Arsenicitalea sp.]